jgi:hypothetical protein
MIIVKGGETMFKHTVKRNTIAVAMETIDKFLKGNILEKDLYRGYPLEIFYEKKVLFERVVGSKYIADDFERYYKAKFPELFPAVEDINGRSEIRVASEERLQEFIKDVEQKYPAKPWVYKDWSIYIHVIKKREIPLPIPTKIQEYYRSEYIP